MNSKNVSLVFSSFDSCTRWDWPYRSSNPTHWTSVFPKTGFITTHDLILHLVLCKHKQTKKAKNWPGWRTAEFVGFIHRLGEIHWVRRWHGGQGCGERAKNGTAFGQPKISLPNGVPGPESTMSAKMSLPTHTHTHIIIAEGVRKRWCTGEKLYAQFLLDNQFLLFHYAL